MTARPGWRPSCRQPKECGDSRAQADYYKEMVLPSMQELRAVADELEGLVAKEFWPYPTYGELLFSVR